MTEVDRIRLKLELSPAFSLTEDAYKVARDLIHRDSEDPEALLSDFLAERLFETLEAARVLIERLAVRAGASK